MDFKLFLNKVPRGQFEPEVKEAASALLGAIDQVGSTWDGGSSYSLGKALNGAGLLQEYRGYLTVAEIAFYPYTR